MAKGTINKVIILGRLGQDPDVRATAGGTTVVNLSVATTELGQKDQSGQRQEKTEWHRCILFGKTAEVAAQYLHKGSQVYIEGRLQTRKWVDQNGQDRYTTEVVANEVQFVGGNNQNGHQNQGSAQPQQQSQPRPGNEPSPYSNVPNAMSYGNRPQSNDFEDFDENIPF